MPAKHDTRRDGMTGAQIAVAAVVAVLSLALAGLAFTGMFPAVRDEMVPFFGHRAWVVPVGVDVGIFALIAAALLLEWLDMPMPLLRHVALIFMGAQVWLNVAAANGSPTGIVGHASLPLLFITCIEAVRHAVRRSVGMALGTVRDGIPLARWILAPWSSFLMFRRMVLQRIHSYPNMVALELGRRNAIAQLQATNGTGWKAVTPGDLVWMLCKGVSVGDAITRVAELTGVPVPGSIVLPAGPTGSYRGRGTQNDAHATGAQNATAPARRSAGSRSSFGQADQGTSAALATESTALPLPAARSAMTFRSEGDLQEEALAFLVAHKSARGERMTTADLAKALHVAKKRAVTIRTELKDREEAA
jgi:hypothetical protein